jgi:hypothetical protein
MTSYTNETLRNFAAPYLQMQEEKYVTAAVNEITTQILGKAVADSLQSGRPKNYMYSSVGPHSIKIDTSSQRSMTSFVPSELSNTIRRINPYYDFKSLFSRVIEKLLETFPQLRIQIDPLNTYMLLDWSE